MSPSASRVPGRYTARRNRVERSELLWLLRSFRLFLRWLFTLFGAEGEIVGARRDDSTDERQIAEPLQRALPDPDQQRDVRIFRQAAIFLRIVDVVQNVNYVRAADARRIIHSGVLVGGVLVQLRNALLGQVLHIFFTAEVQAAGRTSFD